MTDMICSGCVCSYWPRPPTSYTVCRHLAAVQRTRRLCVLSGWAKQMTEFMTAQLPGTKLYVPTQFHPHRLSACLEFISQSVNQGKHTSIAPYFVSKSDASHCAQRSPTTSISHAMIACCQFDHWLMISCTNSKII